MAVQVAIVDDDALFRDMLTEALREGGYSVVAFADGPAARAGHRLGAPPGTAPGTPPR